MVRGAARDHRPPENSLYRRGRADVLAAAPVLSATTLASILGIAVKNAIRILDELRTADIAIEVTHRSKRRLFGLKGLAPLRDRCAAALPARFCHAASRATACRRWRTHLTAAEFGPLPPLTPIERRAFEFTALEEAMAGILMPLCGRSAVISVH